MKKEKEKKKTKQQPEEERREPRIYTLQDDGCVRRVWLESQLWSLRMAFKTAEGARERELVKCMAHGFMKWQLETVEGCGLKWISKRAKEFLLDEHHVDPSLIVENMDLGRTFDRNYPEDLDLRNCLSNNKGGFKKRLTREHVVPISETVSHVADWSMPVGEILESDFDICLVSAEEDAELARSGYRSRRPGGWRRCYRECGIEVERLKPRP